MFDLRQDGPAGYSLTYHGVGGYSLRHAEGNAGYSLTHAEIVDYWDIGAKFHAIARSEMHASLSRVRGIGAEMMAGSVADFRHRRVNPISATADGQSAMEVAALNGRYVLVIDPSAVSSFDVDLQRVFHEGIEISGQGGVSFNLFLKSLESVTIGGESQLIAGIERVRPLLLECASDAEFAVELVIVRPIAAEVDGLGAMDAALAKIMHVSGDGIISACVVDAGPLMRVRQIDAEITADSFAFIGLGTRVFKDVNGVPVKGIGNVFVEYL